MMRKIVGVILVLHLLLPAFAASPSRLLALLDKVKNDQNTRGVIAYAPTFILTYDYGDFEIFLRRICAFTDEKVLIFEVLLKNKTDSTIYYNPNSITLRREKISYPVALVDGTGRLPAFSICRSYLIITSNMYGDPVNMILDASWTIIFRPMNMRKERMASTK